MQLNHNLSISMGPKSSDGFDDYEFSGLDFTEYLHHTGCLHDDGNALAS